MVSQSIQAFLSKSSILVLLYNMVLYLKWFQYFYLFFFQQPSTTTADNFHQLPVAIPVSANNGSEESYGSRPGSTEAAGVGPGLPVSSSARINADHMNGNFSRGIAAGITGRILHILIICKLLTQVRGFHEMTVFNLESTHNCFLRKHTCTCSMFCMLKFSCLEGARGRGMVFVLVVIQYIYYVICWLGGPYGEKL